MAFGCIDVFAEAVKIPGASEITDVSIKYAGG